MEINANCESRHNRGIWLCIIEINKKVHTSVVQDDLEQFSIQFCFFSVHSLYFIGVWESFLIFHAHYFPFMHWREGKKSSATTFLCKKFILWSRINFMCNILLRICYNVIKLLHCERFCCAVEKVYARASRANSWN